MSLSLPSRELYSGESMQGAYFVTNTISENMTSDEFDAVLQRKEAKGFKLHFGGRCGCTVLESCLMPNRRLNYDLAEHIIGLGQEQVLNICKSSGRLPLHLVVHLRKSACDPEQKQRLLKIAEIMLINGANPNLMEKNVVQEIGKTAYFSALRLNDRAIIKLFKKYGGIIPKSLKDIDISENDFSDSEREFGYSKKVFFKAWENNIELFEERESFAQDDSLEALAAIAVVKKTEKAALSELLKSDNHSLTPKAKEIIRHVIKLYHVE